MIRFTGNTHAVNYAKNTDMLDHLTILYYMARGYASAKTEYVSVPVRTYLSKNGIRV